MSGAPTIYNGYPLIGDNGYPVIDGQACCCPKVISGDVCWTTGDYFQQADHAVIEFPSFGHHAGAFFLSETCCRFFEGTYELPGAFPASGCCGWSYTIIPLIPWIGQVFPCGIVVAYPGGPTLSRTVGMAVCMQVVNLGTPAHPIYRYFWRMTISTFILGSMTSGFSTICTYESGLFAVGNGVHQSVGAFTMQRVSPRDLDQGSTCEWPQTIPLTVVGAL